MEKQGTFKGLPLSGLTYQTASGSGETDKNGQFSYAEGETITFSLGNLILGSTPGKSSLSLVDMVPGAENSGDHSVVNRCILLQTLDKDGNLKNGIQITPEITNIASEFADLINFDQPAKSFRSDPQVTSLLGKLNAARVFPDTGNFGIRTIRNASAAQAGFEAGMGLPETAATCHKIIQTASGKINGYATSNNTFTWLGIPYAAPPVGDLRWKPPHPPQSWDGIRDCTQWGDQCGQGDLGPVSYGNLSEDCLNLNVVAPSDAAGKKLPVMVWFHGGGFHAMSANNLTYNHTALPAKGVVIVSVTHRLGPLGYMAHPALSEESAYGGSGNYGQLDLIAALKWVNKNIHAFGGNPDCVTIFGESGGGGKSFNLIISPLAKGLFHRAIIQSGVWSIRDLRGLPLKEAETRGKNVVREMGISDETDVLKAMREKSWQEVVAASQKLSYNDLRLITIDNHYLLDEESAVFKRKIHNDVPVIIGANRTDMDFGMVEGVKDWAEVISQNSNSKIYTYIFGHVPARWRKEGVVAFHGLEIPYVFGCVKAGLGGGTVAGLARTGGAKQPDPGIDELDDIISEHMMNMWVEFAKTGDPNFSGKVGGMTPWEAYEADKDNFLYICDEDVTLQMKTGIVEHYEPPPEGTPPLIPVK